MADSNRLTEALKELADALPRGADGVETQVYLNLPSDAYQRMAEDLHALPQVAGHEGYKIHCGHVTFHVDTGARMLPLVELR